LDSSGQSGEEVAEEGFLGLPDLLRRCGVDAGERPPHNFGSVVDEKAAELIGINTGDRFKGLGEKRFSFPQTPILSAC